LVLKDKSVLKESKNKKGKKSKKKKGELTFINFQKKKVWEKLD